MPQRRFYDAIQPGEDGGNSAEWWTKLTAQMAVRASDFRRRKSNKVDNSSTTPAITQTGRAEGIQRAGYPNYWLQPVDIDGWFSICVKILYSEQICRLYYPPNIDRPTYFIISSEGICLMAFTTVTRSFGQCGPHRPWGPPSLLYKGYRVFPWGKAAGAWRWHRPPT
jgi:hypothetical protein